MKNKKILKSSIYSGIAVMILGTLAHFLYKWTGDNKLIAGFCAINESTWEHLKLLYFPMLITSIIGYFYIGNNKNNYWFARLMAIVVSILFTIAFFYTYSGIIGKNFAPIDIGIFFVAVILGEFTSYKILNTEHYFNPCISSTLIIVIGICFVLFTYKTPKLNLFKDPIDNYYGVNKLH